MKNLGWVAIQTQPTPKTATPVLVCRKSYASLISLEFNLLLSCNFTMADKDPSPKDKEETLYPAVPMVILVVYQLQFHKVFHCLLFIVMNIFYSQICVLKNV